MDVFSLRDTVVGEYRKFARSFTTIFAEDIRAKVAAIYDQGRFWPDPLIQINPSYKFGARLDALIEGGALDPGTAEVFRTAEGPLSLYMHQERAVVLAAQGESYVVTTGTGSGKSLCFFIPIVSAILEEKRRSPVRQTRAIIIYPMNALANSQLEELKKFVGNVPGEPPVTFDRYTGQEDSETRQRIADNPPDILLTNFMMLELLMTRQDPIDRKVIGNCAGLRFLVLDELHTYRGRQGADVALLVRRVRERLSPEKLQCIGTSATMVSEGTARNKQEVVARVASKLFATVIDPSNVIIEELARVTDPSKRAESVRASLGAAIDAPIPEDVTDAALRAHPLAIWVETRLGITTTDVNPAWHRAQPRTLDAAAEELAVESGRDKEVCRAALRRLLLISSLSEQDRTGRPDASWRSFFPFKLHQFISGAGNAFATLEAPGKRTVTVDGQRYLPGAEEKRLYSVHFCRDCGQEYHPVREVFENGERSFRSRDIDDAPTTAPDDDKPDAAAAKADGQEVFGFLTLHAQDSEFTFADKDDDYPETWLDSDASGNVRIKSHYRPWRVVPVAVTPDGKVGSGEKGWFIPGRFRFCLRCGVTQSTAARDRTRLASLSAEGRSSATTVLVGSVLRWMHGDQSGLKKETRKLLGFTDNRQDAALQAGHFNDFLFVSLIRAGFLGALDRVGEQGLRSDELGVAQQRALGFDRATPELRAEWLLDSSLTKGVHLLEAEETLRQILAYRVWFDQRRGWRYTNPSLEQLGLVTVDYRSLGDLAKDDSVFASAPDVLRLASPTVRAAIYSEVFDHLRRWMAIRTQVLEPTFVEQLVQRSHSRLRVPWGLTKEESRRARWLLITPPSRKETSLRDDDLIVRGGSRSGLGRLLKSSRGLRSAQNPEGRKLWDNPSAVKALKATEIDALVLALLKAAVEYGLVSEEATPFADQLGYRLTDSAIVFRRGTPTVDPNHPNENKFFLDFYANLAATLQKPVHPLFGFEAREHTAQVDKDKREVREQRFRFSTKEQKALLADDKRLRDLGESSRFLPVLFCSPTMELGVDISELNAVYLRNVPPTPANYAQRSGRAGRGGQAALVLTYSSSQSPHDQYFFQNPKAMVHGEVRPPLLDLANRDLVESHLLAIWLASTELPLDPSIAQLLVLGERKRPLKDEIREPMMRASVSEDARQRISRVLDMLTGDLTKEMAPWYPGRDQFAADVVERAVARFEDAFGRWRELFDAAEQQRDAAHRTELDYSAPPIEKKAAKGRYLQAVQQLELLREGASSLSSDFYTYRYLATEGFLPGYNFPRLPLMAYIPAPIDGRGKQTYLQRPRFLALSEFGPRSLVYHEGRAYRVVRAMIALNQQGTSTTETRLTTKTVRVCKACGGGHWTDEPSMCHACGAPLGDAEIIKHTYRIENVATQPADRITANDEERQRQGFDLQTTFQWGTRDHAPDVRKGVAEDAEGVVANLSYGPGATITRLNKGLRRRRDRTQLGFFMDPVSGYWQKNEDEDDQTHDPTASPRQWIVPSVQDRKNALLFRPADPQLSQATLTTVQHALVRGIASVFQLEESEILAEPMPKRDERTGFLLYEATEGGAGVLTRLASEPEQLAEVAQAALSILHFDLSGGLPELSSTLKDIPDPGCVAACYRCLMSYYNQPDHEQLDRRDTDAREMLLRLARSRLVLETPTPPSEPPELVGSGDWLSVVRAAGLPGPDLEPLSVDGRAVSLVWRAHYVAALLEPDPPFSTKLEDKGFAVVVLGADSDARAESIAALAKLLGRSA
jgi:hypothetical protein